ncbi:MULTISPECIES: ribonuclease J [Thermoanaerobacter]|jgi:ribonuclease J|uniref:Ribonuclease J n=1 Tax=Thermoanaerobacter pseudethanolicus (strain ATCC 33223 / 39E) TaxID=340099 RepID=B0K999_THEP3|nr:MULTISPECIES: ribonuclease J [Thermoanaerobacter]ABY92781.1 beta-lactamase domain protein [Thermoanaerobacter sp. X514]ABY94712.1 beta-lactamase domain protein [Thermoanaerobacter pseudethanolicus ATCC 33223]MDI3500499.1 ribonuclease [Thermoanaerobacter sp.]
MKGDKYLAHKAKLKIIPLGGLNEIGKNMTVFEFGNDIIVVDCGLAFPDDEMLGIDLVIPDITYLLKNREKVRAIVLTHGHEDHIGALPYILKQLNVPVYGTRLTIGLVEYKLKEQGILKDSKLITVKPREIVEIGQFKVEFLRTSHSIADSAALAIHTPVGTVFHSGDFKIDFTPIGGEIADLHRFAQLGEKGVLVMLCDSTNIERPGYTMSERTVGETFDNLFRKAEQRIIVTTFASNIHRVQQIIDSAHKYGRKVAISGRSMLNVVNVAMELGYLIVPDGLLIDIDEANKLPHDKVAIITTGSQGEPMSALTRMASSEHKKVEIVPGDTVIISASAIPGNEKLISRVINQLFKKGANVIYEALADIHVSGHACQEEIKLLHTLIKPKFFIPVHGEYRHLVQHAKLAETLGMPPQNIFIVDNGTVLEFTKNSGRIAGTVTAGKVLVDGLGVGDVGNIVLRDRKHLAQDGLLVVVVTISKETGGIIAGPDIISRGFVYVRESEDLMEESKNVVRDVLSKCKKEGISEWATIKSMIKDDLSSFLYEKTKRNPMILPIIMEI